MHIYNICMHLSIYLHKLKGLKCDVFKTALSAIKIDKTL